MGMGPAPATEKFLARPPRLEDRRHRRDRAERSLRRPGHRRAAPAWAAGRDAEHVNPHGGAIALGPPAGASGARLALTAINALENAGKWRQTRGRHHVHRGGAGHRGADRTRLGAPRDQGQSAGWREGQGLRPRPRHGRCPPTPHAPRGLWDPFHFVVRLPGPHRHRRRDPGSPDQPRNAPPLTATNERVPRGRPGGGSKGQRPPWWGPGAEPFGLPAIPPIAPGPEARYRPALVRGRSGSAAPSGEPR